MYICLTVDLFKGSNTNLRGVGTFQKRTVNFFNRNLMQFFYSNKSISDFMVNNQIDDEFDAKR